MKVVDVSRVTPEDARDNPIFRGEVSVGNIIGESTDDFRVIVVHFSPGAVNVFHTHSFDQVLYVTEGTGIVATENEEVTVTPGSIIFIPAGENHWHGATRDSAFTHIAVMPPGETSF